MYALRRNQKLIDAIFEKWRCTSEFLSTDEIPPEDLVFELPFGESLCA